MKDHNNLTLAATVNPQIIKRDQQMR